MLYREIIAVCSQIHTKHINTLCGQNVELLNVKLVVPGKSVGIATDYGLDGPGSNPGGGRDFPPVQTVPGAHPASCTMGTGSFLGVEAAGVWG